MRRIRLWETYYETYILPKKIQHKSNGDEFTRRLSTPSNSVVYNLRYVKDSHYTISGEFNVSHYSKELMQAYIQMRLGTKSSYGQFIDTEEYNG